MDGFVEGFAVPLEFGAPVIVDPGEAVGPDAAGLAVVANPVGVQADIVQTGVTGELASSTEEWVRAIVTLANDPSKRSQYGTAGRAQTELRYSVQHGAELWHALVTDFGMKTVPSHPT